MKKNLLFVFLIVALFASSAFCDTAYRYSDSVSNIRGDVIGGATVTVYNANTTTKATIYQYNSTALGELANPTATDTYGRFYFYTTPGLYDVAISGTGITTYTIEDIRVWSSGTSGVFDVSDYGAIGDGTTDDTAAIQAASDAMCEAGGGTLSFPSGSYTTSGCTIGCDAVIEGGGVTIVGSGTFIFGMSSGADIVSIKGFTAEWLNVTGNQGREFFVNYKNGASPVGENTTGYPDPTSVTIYDIGNLSISGCSLGFSKVTVLGGDTDSHIYDNTWDADSTATTSPAYLLISKGLINEVNSGVVVRDNKFEVYAPNGSNQDIVKITGGAADAHIHDNHFENTNAGSSLAQIDMFTGGNRARIHDNSFIDVQLHIKQLIGSGSASPEMSYIDMSGNYFHISDQALSTTAMYLVGTKFSVQDNQFQLIDSTGDARYCIHFDNSDDSGYDTDFPAGTSSKANKVSGNMADLVNTTGDAVFLVADPGTDAIDLFTVNDNILLGGTRFTSGSMGNTAFTGNVWGLNTRGTGTGFFNSSSGVAVGNLSDDTSKAFISSRQEGNKADSIVTTYSSGTDIDADIGSMFWLSGTAAIATISNGGEGQTITLIGSGSGASVVSNAAIFLDGSITMDFTTRSVLQLIKSNDGVWHEIGRKSSYGTLPFEYAGDPNGSITASPGAICKNTNGGSGVSLYVKESDTGNTGWATVSTSLAANPKYHQTWALPITSVPDITYIGGYYLFDATFDDFSTAETLGIIDNSYAAHFMIVTGEIAADEITIQITGDSITDDSVVSTGDTDTITIPISTAVDSYFETEKKWLGQVSVIVTSGTAIDCNFGYCKYWDNGNTDFTVVGGESIWMGDYNGASINIELLHHKSTGWTYTTTGPTVPSPLFSMVDAHGTNVEVNSNVYGSFKRAGGSFGIEGSGSEGIIVRFDQSSAGSIEYGQLTLEYNQ